MSQQDFNIETGDANTGLSMRSAINAALQALASLSSGATAPSTTYAYMLWVDTTNNLLKMRNGANSAWITVGTLDQAFLALLTLGTAQTITAQHTFNPGVVGAPFMIGANAVEQKVTSLNADQVDGYDWYEIPKLWRRVYTTTLSAAATSVSITSLLGDTDIMYKLLIRAINGAASGCAYLIRPNGDSTASNYVTQWLYSYSTSVTAAVTSAATGMYFGWVEAISEIFSTEAVLFSKKGYSRRANAFSQVVQGGFMSSLISSARWTNTADEITSIDIVASAANGLGIGTVIELWART